MWFRIVFALTVLLASGVLIGQGPSEMFRHHYIAREMPGGNVGFGTPALGDFDRDGDLDFAVYDRSDGGLYWFEYQSADRWVRHRAGRLEVGQLGSSVLDVDGDGWPDIVIGGYWFRNPQQPQEKEFTRYTYDSRIQHEIHDLVAADIDGDGKLDIAALGDRDGVFWYKIPESPARNVDWPRTVITMKALDDQDDIHSGFFPGGIGDLDGDGDVDIVLPRPLVGKSGARHKMGRAPVAVRPQRSVGAFGSKWGCGPGWRWRSRHCHYRQ